MTTPNVGIPACTWDVNMSIFEDGRLNWAVLTLNVTGDHRERLPEIKVHLDQQPSGSWAINLPARPADITYGPKWLQIVIGALMIHLTQLRPGATWHNLYDALGMVRYDTTVNYRILNTLNADDDDT